MWDFMCPAQVYQVPEDVRDQIVKNGGLPDDLKGSLVEVEITPSNCVQCGAITAKGGRLTPPEGGDGPNYQQT
jgi:electron-transferring-flavoprotein dehydrogenase